MIGFYAARDGNQAAGSFVFRYHPFEAEGFENAKDVLVENNVFEDPSFTEERQVFIGRR